MYLKSFAPAVVSESALAASYRSISLEENGAHINLHSFLFSILRVYASHSVQMYV